jgi:hypothetical protein
VKRPRKSSPEKRYRWSIYRLRGTPAAFLGSVDAADEKSAIKAAIEQFAIDDPHQQKRLIAQRAIV